jgi:hypothetical protein
MDRLDPRFSNYNGRSASGDEWYYCDIFKVANFRQCEKRIADVLGRFKDKQEKEIYVMHYTNLKHYLGFICDHYDEEIESFNKDLDSMIDNLNRNQMKPIVPNPYQGTSATSTIEERFKEMIRVYLDTLPPTKKEVTKEECFAAIPFTFNKNNGWRWLKEVVPKHKPEITVKYKSKYKESMI